MSESNPASVYDFSALSIDGRQIPLAEYRGKVLLIVNTASRCGFTSQYEGLEALFSLYRERGLVVLGFPCNQFGRQEPGAESEILTFCRVRFGVSFPLFSKIDVNGPGAHPLYRFLKQQKPGFLGIQSIRWNFTKFLIDRNGRVFARYGSSTSPQRLVADIEKLINQTA
jgi:glutathione peroxidase